MVSSDFLVGRNLGRKWALEEGTGIRIGEIVMIALGTRTRAKAHPFSERTCIVGPSFKGGP
jgi:hypothetical protein